MHRFRAGFALFAAALALAIGLSPSPAQAQTATPNDFRLFEAGGRNDHLVIYPLGSEVERDNVTAALDEAALFYQNIWGSGGAPLEFQIVVGFLNRTHTGDPTVYADAQIQPSAAVAFLDGYRGGLTFQPNVCAIEVFTPYASDPARLSTIAHELAHCYQYFYEIGGLNNGYVEETMKWWVEGGADWLASVVYPLQYPGERQTEFDPTQDILTRSYDNMYWWAFLASPAGLGGEEAVIDFLRVMSVSPSGYADSLQTLNGGDNAVEIFHRWAFALLDGRAPFNPPLALGDMMTINAASPGNTRVSGERFAVTYASMTGFGTPDPGNQLFVQVDNVASGNYAVSARAGAGDTRLYDGTPHLFCPDGGGVTLVISRGQAAQGDSTPFRVTWGQMESDTPCVKEAEEVNLDCIIGEWQVTEYPSSMAVMGAGVSVDMSEFRFTFAADGGFSGAYDIIARADGVTLDLNFPFSGTFALTMSEENPTLFAVDSWEWAFESSGVYTAIFRDGTQTDFTDEFYSLGGIELWTPDGALTCQDDLLTWDTAEGSFALTQVP